VTKPGKARYYGAPRAVERGRKEGLMKARLLIATVAVLALCPARAHAGVINKGIDFFYVDGTFGGEYEHIGFAGYGPQATTNGSSDTWGIAYGALAGFRIGMLSIGGLYQRTDVMTGANYLDLNKLYGEVGLNLRLGILMIVLHADIGYAFVNSFGATFNGVGGKAGVAFDFYPVRILSIGPGADFDVQGYSLPSGFTGSYGATFQLRVGIHI
jgi:hypothetical protein